MAKKALFFITLILFSIALGCISNRTPDNDIWARLIAGSYIVEHFAVLKHDFLSYTPVHNWYDHEWGASAVFYFIFKYFGGTGLLYLKGILAALTMFFCFKTIEIRKPASSHAYNIIYYAFMLWTASATLGAAVRCLMFTCLFFAVFLYILERYRMKGGRCLFWLPFLMILWSNMHGGCISGLGLLIIYAAGAFLDKKSPKPYLYTILGCTAALFINPYGFEYVKFLFSAALMNRNHISEWLSPFISRNTGLYIRYKIYLAFILIVQAVYFIKNKPSYKELDKTKLLLIAAVTLLSVMKLRHITFFVFTAGTLMYDEFYNVFNAAIGKIKPKSEALCRNAVLLKETAVYIFLLFLALPVFLMDDLKIRITESAYPRFAVEFVKINNLKGNLFINFDWGSYAAYKLYPDNLIVMDGRYEEVYHPDLFLELDNFHMLKKDWYKIIRDYKTDVLILEKKYPVMYKTMLAHPEWTCVFENNFSGVFVPSSSVKEKYLYPIPDDKYYNSTIFETSVFEILKNKKEE